MQVFSISIFYLTLSKSLRCDFRATNAFDMNKKVNIICMIYVHVFSSQIKYMYIDIQTTPEWLVAYFWEIMQMQCYGH